MSANQQSTSSANSIALATFDVNFAPTRGVSFAVVGALVVITAEDETVTIPSGALAAGIMHALSIKQIVTAGTTATGIVLYR